MLTIIRGLPGSGKSTCAARIQREQGGILIEPDALCYLAGQYVYTPERYGDAVFLCMKIIRALVCLDGRSITPDVIYADCLPKVEDVRKVIENYRRCGAENRIRVIDLSISKEDSYIRNIHHVRRSDIDRMAAEWEPWELEGCRSEYCIS